MSKGKILFFAEDIRFLLKDKKKIRNWINFSIQAEGKSIGTVNIIFCSDSYLLELNQKYLNHDTFTDIITFDYSDQAENISGEIFISIDRIKENAKKFQVPFYNELHRVIIHGFLHLAGYKDKSRKDKLLMTSKEDYYLSLQPNFFS